MAELSTEELSKQVAQLYAEKESERKKRHDLNNNLSKTLLSMSADISRHDEEMAGIEDLGRVVVALNHIVRGVDGKNGLRGDLRSLEATVAKHAEMMNSYKVQLAALAAGFSVVGTFIGSLVIKWIS